MSILNTEQQRLSKLFFNEMVALSLSLKSQDSASTPPLLGQGSLTSSKVESKLSAAIDERRNKPSASNAEAYQLCPAKFRLEEGIADVSSEDSSRGDRIHKWLEDSSSINLHGEELAIAKSCEAERDSLLAIYLTGWGDASTADYQIIKEQRLWHTQRRMSGKADFVAIKAKTGIIIDYKTGRTHVVEPKRNSQLKWLAVLLARSYKLDKVIVAIVQPLCPPYEPFCYTADLLNEARNEVNATLRMVENSESKPVAGDIQCKYCKASVVCPAINGLAVEIAAQTTPLTPALVTKQLNLILALEVWIDKVKEKAKEMLAENPASIPGFHLKPGSIRRNITNHQAAIKELILAGIINEEDVSKMSLVSIPAVEEILISRGVAKQAAKTQIQSVLRGLLITKQSEPTLTHGGQDA